MNIVAVYFLFQLENKDLNRFSKALIFNGYLLVYPLMDAFFKDIQLGFMLITLERCIFHISALIILVHFIKKQKIHFSQATILYMLYSIYFILISLWNGNFVKSTILNYLYPLFFFILIENLYFNNKDFSIFKKRIFFLSIYICFVIFIQVFIDSEFYLGKGAKIIGGVFDQKDLFYDMRNKSIFTGVVYTEAGLNIAMITIVCMFFFNKKITLSAYLLTICLVASTFFTFTRANWVLVVIAFSFFLYAQKNKKKFFPTVVLLFCVAFFILFNAENLMKNKIITDRALDDTYKARFVRLNLFYNNFLYDPNLLIGYGIDTRQLMSLFQKYDLGEAHNGYLEILYRAGLPGMFFYFGFWFIIFKRGYVIYKYNKNPIFISFAVGFICINFVYKYIKISSFAYLLIIFCLILYESLIRQYKQENKSSLQSRLFQLGI